MAYRLGQFVIYGKIYNTSNYATHGIIAFRSEKPGDEKVIHLDLTGNCSPDLQGKAFRFWPDEESARFVEVFDKKQHRRLSDIQVGPTGIMTAQGWARALPCSVKEYVLRARLGEAPPTQWKRRLYLEWQSQNGPVVIEMVGVVVEECIRQSKGMDDEGDWAALPNPDPIPDRPPDSCSSDNSNDAGQWPEINLVQIDEGNQVHMERISPPIATENHDDEKYESIPSELQKQLDQQSAALDRVIGLGASEDEDDTDELIAEMELMDYCIDHAEEELIAPLLGSAAKLPPLESLNDRQIESRLKMLMARLAMLGVAFHVCHHYTLRECYSLLRDKVLPEMGTFREMSGTGWVQNYMTHEYCPQCEEESEKNYLEIEKKMKDEEIKDL